MTQRPKEYTEIKAEMTYQPKKCTEHKAEMTLYCNEITLR